MKNFVQSGDTVTLPVPSGGIASGDPILVGALFGVAAYSAATGNVEAQVVGVFSLPKDASTFGPGDPAYWDAIAGKVTAADSGTNLIGAATASAGSAAATVAVRLNGTTVPPA